MYTKLLQAIYRDSDLSEKTASMIEQKSVFISRRKARQANCIGTKKIFSWLLMGINFLKSSNQLCVHLRNFIKSIWQIHLELYISCHFPIYIWWWFLRCKLSGNQRPFGHMGRYRRNEKRNTVNVRLCLQSYVCRKYLVSGIFKLEWYVQRFFYWFATGYRYKQRD